MRNYQKSAGRNESGFTVILVASLVLPIIIMLFAAILDLSRIPAADRRIEEVLTYASYNAELKYAELKEVPEIDAMFSDASVNLGGKNKFLTDYFDYGRIKVAQVDDFAIDYQFAHLAEAACELAREELSTKKIPLSMDPAEEQIFAIQSAIIRVNVNKSGNYIGKVDGDIFECESSPGILDELEAKGSTYSISDLAINFAESFQRYIPEDANDPDEDLVLGAGLWRVVGSKEVGEGGNPHDFASYWLATVANVKVRRIFSNVFGDGPYTLVVKSHIRPFGAPTKLQAPWFDGAPTVSFK